MTEEISRIRVNPPEAFYAQLGQFVMMFGLAEAIVKQFLSAKVGTDARTSLALFSGTRASEATSLIRRCHEARGEALPPELNTLLQQFLVLNNLRNDLLHHGIDFTTNPPVTTNAASVLNVKAIRASIIDDGTLSCASTDCGRVVLGFAMLLMAIADDPKRDPSTDAEMAGNLSFAVRTPWNYIPRAPANTDRQDRPTPRPRRSQKPPPKS